MKTLPENDTALRTRINLETARLPWSELQRHFAAGTVIHVSDELDLVEVALHIAHDDKDRIILWMSENKLARVSDEQAQSWLEADAAVWTSVVSPFVLVQQNKRG